MIPFEVYVGFFLAILFGMLLETRKGSPMDPNPRLTRQDRNDIKQENIVFILCTVLIVGLVAAISISESEIVRRIALPVVPFAMGLGIATFVTIGINRLARTIGNLPSGPNAIVTTVAYTALLWWVSRYDLSIFFGVGGKVSIWIGVGLSYLIMAIRWFIDREKPLIEYPASVKMSRPIHDGKSELRSTQPKLPNNRKSGSIQKKSAA